MSSDRSRAWYTAPIKDFLSAPTEAVVGRLTIRSDFDVTSEQVAAWKLQVDLLKRWVAGLAGELLLEFEIPRMGRRVDVVLLLGPVVAVIEFKVGATTFDRSAIDQAWDYALDLKNFHEASHGTPIVPILVATETARGGREPIEYALDGVARPITRSAEEMISALRELVESARGRMIDPAVWSLSSYRPTPTIVEAARSLYARHSVESIARHDAGSANLRITSKRVEALIDDARTNRRKVICFVTGVPGAGKTLVGLNVATQRRDPTAPTHAVFLSGNGPLVAVLRKALTSDELDRQRALGTVPTKARAANPVNAFIQNVHHFRDEALRDAGPPVDRVVIFDEAQRAWNLRKTAAFMKQKKGVPDFALSESAFLLSYLDRHDDWAAVICLVGGGQEIHSGEAGISEWLDACIQRFPAWHVCISSKLTDSEYAAGEALKAVEGRPNTFFDDSLHLSVSMRSFRAEHVSAFVKAMLDLDGEAARSTLRKLSTRYPILVTRDLSRAKQWIRSKARGSERSGLVASSKAMRLKPHAIDIRVSVDPVDYSLGPRDDTRSSDYLEDCATEFQVQGLELDWACVNWDADFRIADRGWSYHDFRGAKWENVRMAERQAHLRNAYRVLLTRARQGMVVFVPPGDPADPTRPPGFYDPTYEYLVGLGLPVLQ